MDNIIFDGQIATRSEIDGEMRGIPDIDGEIRLDIGFLMR